MLQSREKHFDNLVTQLLQNVNIEECFDQNNLEHVQRKKIIENFQILPAALRSYIPKQLLKDVEIEERFIISGVKYVQEVLDDSNDNLRMYGSADDFLETVNIYMEFPLNRKMFPREMGSYYYTIPSIYHTLKKEVLYCKQDLLFYLQSCVYKELGLCEDAELLKLKFAELIDYMKKHEERLGGCYEFVKNDYDVFENIQKPFRCNESLYIFQENAEMIPKVEAIQAVDCEKIQKKDFVKVFENLISKYPCVFLPNSETKDKNATAVVRVFDHGRLKFVMESELFAAINLKNPDQKPLECMDIDGHYRTIDYKHVLERYRDQIGDIDFVYQKIPFGLHAATPIVAPTGDHCIQAVDAYMDIITETFFAGVFQKITRNTCHMIPKFVTILEKYFPSNIKYRYFINLKLVQKLREELEEFWKPIEDKPMKRVRNVGPRGFTVDDLKNELKYLEYTKIFPEITALARSVYTDTFHLLKPSDLETSDMFLGVQRALTLVVTRRFPCLLEFVYRQKVCMHNRREPCDHCLEAIKEAEARVEAEIKAESEQASSTVTATTSGDDSKEKEDSEESKHESVTNEAPSIVKRDPENLKNSVESSFFEVETKSIPAISKSEVLSNSNNQKISMHHRLEPRESCLKATKGESEQAPSSVTATASGDDVKKEEDFEKSKSDSLTNEAPSVAIKNPVEAEINPLPAISKPEVPECDTALTDSNTHICEKCMETSNEAKKEVKETYRKMMSQVKEHNEQLESAQKALEEKEKKFEELEKTVEEQLLKAVKTANKGKDSIEALLSQLVEKDKEIDELKKGNLEECEKLKNSILDLEKRVKAGLDKQKENNSKIQKLELKNLKLTEEKNQEIEKLKKQQAMVTKEHKKEMEQLKRNASESTDELKKLTTAIAEKEVAENLLKRSNKGLLEKLQKSESSLKEVTNRCIHLETEVAEKNRKILELQKSAKNQVSEQEKTKKELETRILKIRGMLDDILPLEQNSKEKLDTECLICLDEMRRDQKKLKCEHCRKIVHLECASEWLKNHRSCAHCRREQLDPTEFPSLR